MDTNNVEIICQRFHVLFYNLPSSVAASVVQEEKKWMVTGDPAIFVPDCLITIRQSIVEAIQQEISRKTIQQNILRQSSA